MREPPRAVSAAGRFRGQIRPNVPFAQLRKPRASRFHCFHSTARKRRRNHLSRSRNTVGVWQKPK